MEFDDNFACVEKDKPVVSTEEVKSDTHSEMSDQTDKLANSLMTKMEGLFKKVVPQQPGYRPMCCGICAQPHPTHLCPQRHQPQERPLQWCGSCNKWTNHATQN